MRDRSAMGTRNFVVGSIAGCLLSMIIYNRLLFTCLPNMTYRASWIVLWIMLSGSIAVCSGVVFRKRKTCRGIIASLLIPYGIYTIGAYWRVLHLRIEIILLIAAVLSLLAGIFVMVRIYDRTKSEMYSVANRLGRWFTATGCIFTAAMAVIIAPLFFTGALGPILYGSGFELETRNGTEEQIINTNGYEYESQGSFARVQLADGKWDIINRSGVLVLKGADFIHPLPEVTQFGSAVINGHACLLATEILTDDIFITEEFEDFCAVSEVWDDLFAVVENKEGLKGIVDIWGRIVIPAQFKSIKFYDISPDPLFGDVDIIFNCVKKDGFIKTVRIKW